ncbi:MAG: histidinol-phosphate aminotransferase family protein [Desulfurococcales archaeon]|nr:histidinol-phosphate aminotransferase family protein [Desulfurococcales archaeon]
MHIRSHGGKPPRGVLDFSTPLNPLGPPPAIAEAISRLALDSGLKYPDYSYKEFREAVANYYEIDPGLVVPLNGAAEALQLALTAFKPKTLVSIEPTFGDHGFTATRLGIPWITVPLGRRRGEYVFDPSLVCSIPGGLRRGSLLLLSNPDNPTGSLASPKAIAEIAECMEGGVVLLDEAFMDLAPIDGYSLLGRAPDNIVVVRSLTKSLAVPGLRIGFAYTRDNRLAGFLEAARQPWNVNTLASRITVEALTIHREETRGHIERARGLIRREAAWLGEALASLGVVAYRSMAPFILAYHPQARHPGLQAELNRRGVHVRDASSFTYLTPYHSRVSVRLRRENQVLLEAFKDVLGG